MGFSFVDSLAGKFGKNHRNSFKIDDNAITLAGAIAPTAQGIVDAILSNGEPIKIRRPAVAISGLDGKGLSRSCEISPTILVHGKGEETGLAHYLSQAGNKIILPQAVDAVPAAAPVETASKGRKNAKA